jgi:hypothetical protein
MTRNAVTSDSGAAIPSPSSRNVARILRHDELMGGRLASEVPDPRRTPRTIASAARRGTSALRLRGASLTRALLPRAGRRARRGTCCACPAGCAPEECRPAVARALVGNTTWRFSGILWRIDGATGLEPATSDVAGRYRVTRLQPAIARNYGLHSRHFLDEPTRCDRLRSASTVAACVWKTCDRCGACCGNVIPWGSGFVRLTGRQ